MCEDKDKTVIKKRDAQGSESKRAEPAECKESQQQSRDLSNIENTGGCRHKQAVCGGGVGHPEKESSHTGTTSVQATASTGVPELPKAGVHRSPTQLGVGLEVGGKLGVINWPRSGVEACIRKALGLPLTEHLGFLSPLPTQTSLEADC